MIKRKFNPHLYDRYDSVGKDALCNYLLTQGHEILDVKETYNADVVSEKLGLTYFNEAEVKISWKKEWPSDWSEVRLPERKKRLVKMYKEQEGVLNFYIFRADLKQVWRIKDTLLTDECLREAKGRFIPKGEKFFHINTKDAELITL